VTTPGPFVAVLITLLVVGAIVQFLVLAYRYRRGSLGPRGKTADGEVVDGEERFDDLGRAVSRGDTSADSDVDPSDGDTIPCPRCETLNEAAYTFCRNCTANISVD